MRSIIIFLAATVLALWNSPPVRAEERDAARGAVDALIERQMERLAIPGVSLALIQDGHIVDVRTYGYADREAERPVAQDTLFETASLSKAAFSYFVLRQVDRGVLALDEPLAQILPHPDIQDGRAARITPRMVLSHQSGFPNWRFQNEDGQLDIKFEPGSEFLYSGEGFEYLALALAHALDTDLAGLERLMRADMRQALSCDPGPWTWSADLQARLATGYIDGQAQDDWRIESPMVSASLFSSARRYACVVSAILNGTGLSADMRAAAMSPQVVLFDDDDFRADFGLDAWGLGIAIKDTDFGRAISHGGINEGFTSWFTALRDRRAGYVFLTNSQKGPELNAAIEDELLALALALD